MGFEGFAVSTRIARNCPTLPVNDAKLSLIWQRLGGHPLQFQPMRKHSAGWVTTRSMLFSFCLTRWTMAKQLRFKTWPLRVFNPFFLGDLNLLIYSLWGMESWNALAMKSVLAASFQNGRETTASSLPKPLYVIVTSSSVQTARFTGSINVPSTPS